MKNGWTSARIKDLFELKYGKGLPKKKRNNSGNINVYGSNGIIGCHNTPLTEGYTIIIGRKGSVGEVNIDTQKCWPIDTTYYIDKFFFDLPPQYWAFYLKFLRIGQHDKSSAIPGVNRNDIYQIVAPVPPALEQKRIVSKLEKLMAKVDQCKARLEKIPSIIKRFRQSVLAAACSGELTKDWRKNNKVSISVPTLLRKIKKYRIKNSYSKRELNHITKYYKYRDGMIFSKENNGTIPDSWVLCKIGDIGNVYNGSTPSRKIIEYWNGDISWVSSGEVQNNVITETKEKITKLGYENCSVRLVPKGSVLIAMIGEGKTRGQSSILKIPSTINQNIAAVFIDHGKVIAEYLWYWFQFQYEANRQIGSGSGPQALNCQRVRELPFNYPPLEEQQEIVRRVESLFKIADQIEERYNRARDYVDKLTQSILAKAFRGELVPQDPKDEPASVLLERIRAERAKAESNKKMQKKSTKPLKPVTKASQIKKVNV